VGVADKIIAKGKPLAANLLEASAADIDYADGSFRIVGTDRKVSLFDVAKANKGSLDDEFTRTPESDTYPNGCHICELEVDPDTGTLEILSYSVMDDFGKALNPLLLQGQIHGGVGQGVGQALSERAYYDKDSGQLLSGSLMDYAFPRADIVPPVKFDMHNSPCTTNPLGVKGAGEAGAIGAPPSVVNAIVDAIYPHTGVKHVDMPVTAASLWQVIEANRGKRAA
jgi:carbon-monoxide dehydrogenase large subunit